MTNTICSRATPRQKPSTTLPKIRLTRQHTKPHRTKYLVLFHHSVGNDIRFSKSTRRQPLTTGHVPDTTVPSFSTSFNLIRKLIFQSFFLIGHPTQCLQIAQTDVTPCFSACPWIWSKLGFSTFYFKTDGRNLNTVAPTLWLFRSKHVPRQTSTSWVLPALSLTIFKKSTIQSPKR